MSEGIIHIWFYTSVEEKKRKKIMLCTSENPVLKKCSVKSS